VIILLEKILSSNIKIKCSDPINLKKLLDLEMDIRQYSRSESKITVEGSLLVIDIFTSDLIAYKATVNNYINLLDLINKTYEVEL
jgi:tRNA threonylcarbamoyladenosine modification (KEOPS) complex  Pcc1 subunit